MDNCGQLVVQARNEERPLHGEVVVVDVFFRVYSERFLLFSEFVSSVV